MIFDLSTLNEEQHSPVVDTEGAVLVTAGAGSGKTRLLTHRIAHLLENVGVSPYNILAITFTNKAAKEMKTRLIAMTARASEVWISTFHSMCVRILRVHAEVLGYTSSFSIYGEAEKDKLLASLVADFSQGEDDSLKKKASMYIGEAKNEGIPPEKFEEEYGYVNDCETLAEIYDAYENALKKNNAFDFDDLLLKTRDLLLASEQVREKYQNKFKYIHIDEFQDTNSIQYELIKILGAKHRNVCAVGDEDQCIYGWRGANINNIRNFIEDFNCRIYKLEQNYRSTPNILDIANKLIAHNDQRIDKKLWTQNQRGCNVEACTLGRESDEADFVVQTILALKERGYRNSDFAVLMRVNALTRPFEQRFMQYGIAHQIFGGFKFYDRKEIKDLLAYLRIVVNPRDDEAIMRVINFPRRGIGQGGLEKIQTYAAVSEKSLFDTIMNMDETSLPETLKSKVKSFSAVINCLILHKDDLPLHEIVKYLVRMLDLKTLYAEENEENTSRKANINELINSIKEFSELNPEADLSAYMQSVSLWSDLDEMSDEQDAVKLATVHSAKGLEFRAVFVVGLEEGLFPISRAFDDKSELEEERRLCYVAITRARERLYLTHTRSRFMYGKTKDSIPSRFLQEAGLMATRGREQWHPHERQEDEMRYDDSEYDTPERRSRKTDISEYAPGFKAAKPQNSTPNVNFAAGDKVSHKRFGQGTIVSVTDDGKSAIVEFERIGKMNLALAFAPIEKL